MGSGKEAVGRGGGSVESPVRGKEMVFWNWKIIGKERFLVVFWFFVCGGVGWGREVGRIPPPLGRRKGIAQGYFRPPSEALLWLPQSRGGLDG